MAEELNLNKLVSLTFDEDPEVRKRAANLLAESEDPAALFALLELSYDKETSVRDVATKILEKKKNHGDEMMSFAEIFGRGAKKDKEEKKQKVALTSKEKVMKPIEKLFEKRLGKEKAEIVKRKMMPTIEKIYLKTKKKKGESEEKERRAVQEFLTDYLEAMADIKESEAMEALHEQKTETEEPAEDFSEGLDVVGKELEPDKLSMELAAISEHDLVEGENREAEAISQLPDTFFKKAYESMMLSEGDEEIMRKEMKRMIGQAEKDIKLAFKLAKRKFKEMNITHLTAIKNGMRNINTEVLEVIEVESKEYQKSKRIQDTMTRIVLNDNAGNEGVLYLFEGRGALLSTGMKIKVSKSYAKTFKFSGETALTLGKRGNVYIVL